MRDAILGPPVNFSTPINREPAMKVGVNYALLFLGCLIFHVVGTWSLPLIDRDEPRFAEAAHVAHKIAHAGILMPRDEIAHHIVKIKRSRNWDRSDEKAERPIENRALLHK